MNLWASGAGLVMLGVGAVLYRRWPDRPSAYVIGFVTGAGLILLAWWG